MALKKIRDYVIRRVACGTCWNICEAKMKFADGRPDEPLFCSVCNAGTGQPKKTKQEIWESGHTYRGRANRTDVPSKGKRPEPGVDFKEAEVIFHTVEVDDPPGSVQVH